MDQAIAHAPRRPFRPVLALSGLACAVLVLMSLAAGINGIIGSVPTPQVFRSWLGVTHVTLMVIALMLTVAQVFLPKGTRNHQRMGYAWGATLIVASLISFGMHQINGGFSPPHAFSIGTLILVPVIGYLGATRRRKAHRIVVVTYTLIFLVFAGAMAFKGDGRGLAILFWDIWR